MFLFFGRYKVSGELRFAFNMVSGSLFQLTPKELYIIFCFSSGIPVFRIGCTPVVAPKICRPKAQRLWGWRAPVDEYVVFTYLLHEKS